MPKFSLLLTILCLWVAASRLQAQTCANRALSFDGVDDFVTAVGAPVNGTTDFTLEARFFCTSTSTNTRRLLTLGNNSPSNRFELCERGGFLTFVRQAVNGSTSLTQVSTVNLRDNAWHHLAVTRQGTSINFYLDGVAQTPVTLTGTLNYNLFYFGRALSPYATNSNWQGSIDEVKIWNIARSLSDITAGAGSPQVCPIANLVAFYSFDQGIGGGANTNETVLQECLNLNDGTLSNFALTGATSNWVCGDANFAGAAGGCPAQFTYTISGCDSVSFQNTTPQAPAYTFTWAFGDGSTSSNPSPGHVYIQPGAYQVCLTATSAAGTACTTCQTVTLSDMVPPTAICNLPLTITLPPGAPIVMITPGMINNGSSDNCQLSSLSVNPNQMNCQQACGGPQTVTLIATDWAGNTSTCTTTVNVIDNTPPSVSCPANTVLTGTNSPNGCFATYTPQGFATFDICGSGPSQYRLDGGSWMPVSQSVVVPAGAHALVYQATDFCGNTAFCTQAIIVSCDSMSNCACTAFSNLSIGEAGAPLSQFTPLQCDTNYWVPCPVAGRDFELRYTFGCTPGVCSPGNMNYSIINTATGATIVNHQALGGVVFVPIDGDLIATPGVYQVIVEGTCGQQTCQCSINLTVESCGNCANRALDFDGINDQITLNPSPVSGNSDFTAEALFTCTSTSTSGDCDSNFRRLITLGGSGSRFELGECGGLLRLFWYDGNFFGPTLLSDINVQDGLCRHIAVTRAGSRFQSI